MRSRSPEVTLSLLNWNGAANTLKCLDSIQTLDYPNLRILVVDNASKDNSVQQIHAAFPEVEIIQSPQNLGYAGGHRLALEDAQKKQADLLWILNNDTLVNSDTLTGLVQVHQRTPRALYGSVTLEPDHPDRIAFGGGWQLDAQGRPRAFGDYNLLRGRLFDECFPDRREQVVAALNGSSFLIPLPVVRQHGFMDESFFMNAEETDYCFRLGKQGVPSILVPASTIKHMAGGSYKGSPELSHVLKYYEVRNRLLFMRRHEGFRVYVTLIAQGLQRTWKMQILSLVKPRHARTASPRLYYESLGIRHALLHRIGKTIAPEAYLK